MEQRPRTFRVGSLKGLRAEIAGLGLDLPVDDDLSSLGHPAVVGQYRCPNRFVVQPMEGADACADGSPDRLTFRRYMRYARGGFGLIWVEATAVAAEARSNPCQLYLHEGNVEAFAELVKAIRTSAREAFSRDVLVILQLAHAGRYCKPDGNARPVVAQRDSLLDAAQGIPADYPLVGDGDLVRLGACAVDTARLAAQAGVDGVDIKSCHGDLLSELLASSTRPGNYGGAFENRSRFLLETVGAIRARLPELLLASRIDVHDGDEAVRLAVALQSTGLDLLGVAGERLRPAAAGRAREDVQEEHPLAALARSTDGARRIRAACPALPLVGGDYTVLHRWLPHVAAAAVRTGTVDLVGLGRAALAYPDAPADVMASGQMDSQKCCISCSACADLLAVGGRTGCVIRDSEIYGPEYRRCRRFSPEFLRTEANRCRECSGAPCSENCPTRIDVPAFIRAYADGNVAQAFAVIRRANVLPEMCSHLCPVWLQCEGACVESILTENAIPIRDLQYVVCWQAREQGLTGVVIPETTTGRRVAIVGGGPAGAACAARLLERGHSVTIIERDTQLGGVPRAVIPASRIADTQEEIDALLGPALRAGRLELRLRTALGRDVALDELRGQYDAVLLAAGLWQERSLEPAVGVVDALTFLRAAKDGNAMPLPSRVAVLGGGDCAMDAAVTARQLGAEELYVVYSGSFADMHWHLSSTWFKNSGTHCLTLTQPLGYEVDDAGHLRGVRICRTEYGAPGEAGSPIRVPGSESLLGVEFVVEAMGLGPSGELKSSLATLPLTADGLVRTVAADSSATELVGVYAAGALVNGGASVAQCIAEGMHAAAEIDRILSQGAKEG